MSIKNTDTGLVKTLDATLETERLLLRQIQPGDLDAIAQMNGDPEVMKFIGDGQTMDRTQVWRFMASLLGHWQLRGFGMYAVEEKESKAFIGLIGLHFPPVYPGPELGWRMLRESWGKGYAFEAAVAVREHAFAQLDLPELLHLINAKNAGSVALAKKLGAVFDRQENIDGDLEDIYITKRPQAFSLGAKPHKGVKAPLV